MVDTPDAPLSNEEPVSPAPPAGQVRRVRVVSKRRSMWEDPTVRRMALISGVLVVVFLSVIVSALYLGLIGNTAPRSAAEREVAAWESFATADGATLDQVQSYALALVNAGQFVRAESVVDSAKKNEGFDLTQGQNLLFVEAEIARGKKSFDTAIAKYAEVMDLTKSAYETELEEGPEFQNWAVSFGLHQNYYLSAAARGAIYAEQKQWPEALEMLDIFLEKYPNEAYVLASRGDVKAALGDTAGAESDYRAALRFIDDLPEALEGLDRIGATR